MDVRMKKCTKCKVEYPATREYFSTHKKTKDGLETRCHACIREKNRLYREKNNEKEKARKKKWREENPEKVKAYNSWYRNEYPEKVRFILSQYRTKNREKLLEDGRLYREENRDKERARGRKYAEENREKHLKNGREWRLKNPDRVRELDREWKEKNKDKALVIKQRRMARKQGLPDTFTPEDYQKMMTYWGSRCAICEREAQEGLIIVPDHWIALSDKRLNNPGTVPQNILPLCHSAKAGMLGCNNLKWSKDGSKWLTELYEDEDAQIIKSKIERYFNWVQNK